MIKEKTMIILHKLLFFFLCAGAFPSVVKNDQDFRAFGALIFTQCKGDHETVIINDDFERLDFTSLQQLYHQFHSVILLKKFRYRKKFSHVKKVDDILMIIPSDSLSPLGEVTKILGSLHRTPWWNVMTPVYILHSPDNNCELATDILWLMWKYDILTSYYLCIENDEVQIYTYNPFTNRAPSSWTEVQITPAKMKWTLYQRQYYPGIICQGLDFDRTKHFDDYPITVAIPAITKVSRSLIGRHVNYNYSKFCGAITAQHYHFIIDALVTKLNVRPSLYVIKKADDHREINELYLDDIKDVSNNISLNLILTAFYLPEKVFKSAGLTQTYPLAWKENGIATRNRGYQTLAEKVWDFYGIWTISYTIFILLITFVVIWFFESRRTAFAVFEIIRLSTSHSLHTRMNTLPLRIFFIAILIYFLIIQATFSSHLANFLTKPELRRHAETREDLRDLNYQINDAKYTVEHLAKTKEELIIDKAVVRTCLNYILYNDSSVACIFNHFILLEYTQSEEAQSFYISKRSTESLYSTYIIKNHWPLSDRVNTAIMSLEELGFRQRISGQWKDELIHNLTIAEARSRKDFQPIKLENLMLGFWILAVGLISATLSFCIEIFISHKSK